MQFSLPMISQMILPPKSFPANVTGIGPLIRVRSLMDKQIVTFGEMAMTVFANELLLWSRRAAGFCGGSSGISISIDSGGDHRANIVVMMIGPTMTITC